MKRIRKLGKIALGLALVVGFTGCGSNNNEDQASNEKA